MGLLNDHGQKILAKRPDRKSKSCMLIGVIDPDNKNIALKEAEKISKYKDLGIEIDRVRNVEAMVVPMAVGALGTLRKDFAKGVELIPGRPKVSGIQNISLSGTVHIL